MNWRRWRWVDDGLLPLLLITIRLCWLWPWLQLLQRWVTPAAPQPWLPLWAVLLFMLGGMVTARLALARTGSLRRARIWVVGVGLLAILGLLWWHYYGTVYALWDARWLWQVGQALTHPEVTLLPLLTLLVAAGSWLRGVLDGRHPVTHDDVWHSFTTAFIASTLLLLVAQLDPLGLPPNTDRWLLIMVASGLAALALSGLQLSQITGRWEARQETQIALNRYWLLSVSAVIAAMLALGLALAAVVSPGTVAQALSWTTVVLNWLGTILGYILFAVAYVLFLFLTPLYEWIRSRLAAAPPREPMTMQGLQEQLDALSDPTSVPVPPLVEATARWGGLVVVLVVIAAVIALTLRYFRQREDADPEETRETIFSRGLLEEQLASLWHDLLNRLRRSPETLFAPYLSLNDEQENRRAIRARYQALLAQAKARGYPRLRGQTPGEYITRLAQQFPAVESSWTTVTEEYAAARYGLQAPSTAQVARMLQACDEIQDVLTAEGPKRVSDSPQED